ncbi:MAG: NHL repeat-containing protein [Sedimentisphaerales bacterium]|nr:NHL repeat-containing protein [Sedimentisphaerales bacterium]
MNRTSGTTDTRPLVGGVVALAAVVAIIAVVRFDVFGDKGSGLGKGFTYDIAKLTKVDPNLILYDESAGPIVTGLAESHGIAVDLQGAIYVAGDQAICIFSQNGDLKHQIALAGTPRCLEVDADGTIYVGLKDHMEIYDAQGQRQASWESLGADAVLTSIAVTKDNIFVADAGNRVVIRYDRAGNIIRSIGQKDPDRNIPGFVIPSPYFDLAISRDGLLRVVNTGRLRIEAYTFDGDFEFSWGKPSMDIDGFCGCCNPVNIAVLPGGGFITCEKGLVRVKVYDSEGRFTGVVASPDQLVEGGEFKICEFPEQGQVGGFDVAVDSAGRVFVLDTIKNIIRIFTELKGSS